MAIKGSTSPPSGIILTPNEYKEYIHLTQAAKSASILCLLPRLVMLMLAFHIHLDLGFLILEPLIIFLVIRIFFSLTITLPLPMITLANGSQTMAEGISSACPIPQAPRSTDKVSFRVCAH